MVTLFGENLEVSNKTSLISCQDIQSWQGVNYRANITRFCSTSESGVTNASCYMTFDKVILIYIIYKNYIYYSCV